MKKDRTFFLEDMIFESFRLKGKERGQRLSSLIEKVWKHFRTMLQAGQKNCPDSSTLYRRLCEFSYVGPENKFQFQKWMKKIKFFKLFWNQIIKKRIEYFSEELRKICQLGEMID